MAALFSPPEDHLLDGGLASLAASFEADPASKPICPTLDGPAGGAAADPMALYQVPEAGPASLVWDAAFNEAAVAVVPPLPSPSAPSTTWVPSSTTYDSDMGRRPRVGDRLVPRLAALVFRVADLVGDGAAARRAGLRLERANDPARGAAARQCPAWDGGGHCRQPFCPRPAPRTALGGDCCARPRCRAAGRRRTGPRPPPSGNAAAAAAAAVD
eukprot:TRINITY_DN2593_c0_g1_i2.p2 TRINITY_DN2593_c0_g1~~TRINITY_DN2593_c0_g1_i2.p2  ORF type:complete len:214 (+),score=34.08 TRINITY_DN2593_c0_g1_i2:336-977(+)